MATNEDLLKYGVESLNVFSAHSNHPTEILAVLAMMVSKVMKRYPELDKNNFYKMLDNCLDS